MLRETLGVNARDHFTVYCLASLANLILSVPQFQAVNSALDMGFHPQGMTGTLISRYGSKTGLLLDFAMGILIFQGVLGVLIIGMSASASPRKGWKWQYSAIGLLFSSYVAYHLGGKFLNALGWVGVLETSGYDVSGVYGDLFWSGLLATILYLLSILFLRRSYGKLMHQRVTFSES